MLGNAGVDFGDVSTQNPYNLKGNRENNRIMNLHDSLLRYNDGSWDSPPAVIEWPKHLREERDGIIHEFHDSELWGFKDPRSLLALDGWLEVLPNVIFAATFRHPMSVARSLQERNRFPVEKSLCLWKKYNEKLLLYSDRYNFPIISFDMPEAPYRVKVGRILDCLNLASGSEVLDFFEDAFRHQILSDGEVPADIAELYEELNRRAI